MWSLYQGQKFLEPLKFSNGKTQEDIVREVLQEIKQGRKIIFIRGACGSGKSGIALNIAKEIGKASVVVPGKSLQEQYQRDYQKEKYLKKRNNEKLKINIVTGRKNHKCKFLEDGDKSFLKVKEKNLRLLDIFEEKKEAIKEISADSPFIPCKIELKEKNWLKIKEYLQQNNKIDFRNIKGVGELTRASVACVCPYWSPVLEENYELKNLDDAQKKRYKGLDGNSYVIHKRKAGCSFYEQYESYSDSDVIVFNSLKYKIEMALNRKPETEIEIIDECDEFLDSFTETKALNLEKIINSLIYFSSKEKRFNEIAKEIGILIRQIKIDKRIEKAIIMQEILPLKATSLFDLFKLILKNPEFLMQVDEESYFFELESTAKMFEDFLGESYVFFTKKDENLLVSIVTINLEKRVAELIKKSKNVVLMSGTIHSESVLKSIFGLKDFKIIEAETKNQGEIRVKFTGCEKDCKYSNFTSGKITRKEYLQSFERCVEISKKPALVHINSFMDLPTQKEKKDYNIKTLISREEVEELKPTDKSNKEINDFKEGKIDILFSTKCSRGIDFPGDQCRSIIFSKYPNPNVKDAFWKILSTTKPHQYWDFYNDKAKRELWQRVYRGVRFDKDFVEVLSPDLRVLNEFQKK